jgi:hypothetical protein
MAVAGDGLRKQANSLDSGLSGRPRAISWQHRKRLRQWQTCQGCSAVSDNLRHPCLKSL